MSRFNLVLAIILAGCGHSGLQVQARAAKAASSIIVDLGAHARAQRTKAQKDALAELTSQAEAHDRARPYQEEAAALVAEVRLDWEPVVAGYNALVEAHRTWVDWLLVYVDRGELNGPKVKALIERVISTWRAFSHAGDTVNFKVPKPPTLLVQLMDSPNE